MTKRFWGTLAALDLIDKSVRSKRDATALSRALKSIRKKEHRPVSLRFDEDSVFFKDMHFFWAKGLKLKYIAKIFDDLSSAIAFEGRKISSVSARIKSKDYHGETQYVRAGKKDLYSHIIDTSKYVFTIEGFSDEEKKGAALLALIHDMGKFKHIRKHYKISSTSSHEAASAEYARKILLDQEDTKMVYLFSDWLENKKEMRKFPENTYGKILSIADIADRENGYDGGYDDS